MKTIQQIDKWFTQECDAALKEIPKIIKDSAKTNCIHMDIIAETISRKKCFNKKAVMTYLTNII